MEDFDAQEEPTRPYGLTLSDAVLLGRHKRILLAEDDPAMRRLIASRLRKAGCLVVEAQDGTEAMAKIADALLEDPDGGFDLVISDVRMPGHSGIDLMACYRGPDLRVPVILITAFGSPELHKQALRFGARAVFDKPFDLDDLITAVINLE